MRLSHVVLGVSLAVVASGCARSAKKDKKFGDEDLFLAEGLASYYGKGFHGRRTANGETFNKNDYTAAHRTLRFNSCVDVWNIANGEHVRVRVNDRGPYAGKRIIDLSEAAARELGMIQQGVARVRLYRCED